jgi:hypothetical protein
VFVLSIVASTGRVGNVLVALRCVEIRDKAVSMAFQVIQNKKLKIKITIGSVLVALRCVEIRDNEKF